MPTPSLHDRWRTVLTKRDIVIARALLDETPINHVFPGGDGVLSMMVMRGWEEGVRLLLEAGWNPLPDTDAHHSPMALAAGRLQDMALLRLLAGAAPLAPLDHAPGSSAWKAWAVPIEEAMFSALAHDHLEAVAFFQECFDWSIEELVPHATTPQGVLQALGSIPIDKASPVLVDAVKNGQSLPIIRTLIEAGASLDFEDTDRYGRNTRRFAIDHSLDRPDVFRFLTKHSGADCHPGLPALVLRKGRRYDGQIKKSRLDLLGIALDHVPDMAENDHVFCFMDQIFSSHLRKNETKVGLDLALLPRIAHHPAVLSALEKSQEPFYTWLLERHRCKLTPEILALYPSLVPKQDVYGNTFFHTLARAHPYIQEFLGESLKTPTPFDFLVEAFTQKGLDASLPNDEGERAIDVALSHQHAEMASALVRHHPDKADALRVLIESSGWGLLDDDDPDQTWQRHLAPLLSFLDETDIRVDGLNLLHLVFESQQALPYHPPNPDYVRALVHAGVPVNEGATGSSVLPEGTPPLFLALSRSKSNRDLVNDYGLRKEPARNWATIALLLIEHGADPWQARADGKRPVDTYNWDREGQEGEDGWHWRGEEGEVLALRKRIQIESVRRRLGEALPGTQLLPQNPTPQRGRL